jgi:murein DD-endopeptidase MepM/ murein hydrolase activator NlpD
VQRPSDVPVHQAQVEARILWTPRVVHGSDGRRHLAYELRITSFQDEDDPLKLVRVAVFFDRSKAPLTMVEGAGIGALLSQQAPEGESRDGVAIATGRSKTLFFWLTLPPGPLPSSLRHQLVFRTSKGKTEQADNVDTAILPGPPIRIGPPLRGGRWLAVEGPSNHRSHHWGGLVAVDGKLTIPQRFAIDWFGLDDGNHSVQGTHDALVSTVDADWVGYGHDVLAVADGVVVDARDGIPNGRPMAPQESPDDITARTLYGNFVVLEIAPNTYAHYAHLQSASVAVKVGQKVRRGAVLGHLGQTGAAGAPHLHFHVSDRPTFEQSEGLPYQIDAFVLRGRATLEDTFDPATPVDLTESPARPRRAELPLDGSVVTFP